MTAPDPTLDEMTATVGAMLERCRMLDGSYAAEAHLKIGPKEIAVLEAIHVKLGRALDHRGVSNG